MSGPPSSKAPAGVPSSGTGKYVAVALLLLVGIGVILVWKFVLNKPQEQAVIPPPPPSSATETQKSSNPLIDEVPLPPPVVDSGPETGPPTKGTGTTVVVVNGGCDGQCVGQAPPELSGALQVRGANARRCYNAALAADPTLKGHVKIAVRISANGNACSASVAESSIGGNVAQCVAGMFRGGGYPAPKGGCVDAVVPMSFVSQNP
jgi:hypothetical protein